MAGLMKKGSDGLLNCTILGAVTFGIISQGNYSGSQMFSWVGNLISMVSTSLASYMSWAGTYGTLVEFVLLGAIVGYILDRV